MSDSYVEKGWDEIEEGGVAAVAAARESMSDRRPLRLQPTSVGACYRTALARLTIPSNVTLCDADLGKLPPVLAGEEQLRLVIINLIENALDAIADQTGHIQIGGRVVVDPIDSTRPWVELSVIDDGPGVLPAHREKIFEPDFSTKRSIKNLGFGLWWTKSLVQRFGGSISITDSSGSGCAFVVRLPPAPQTGEN